MPPEFSGATGAAGGMTYHWEGSGAMPTGYPGAAASAKAARWKITWEGDGPMPAGGPGTPGRDGSASGWKYTWLGSGPMPARPLQGGSFSWNSATGEWYSVPASQKKSGFGLLRFLSLGRLGCKSEGHSVGQPMGAYVDATGATTPVTSTAASRASQPNAVHICPL